MIFYFYFLLYGQLFLPFALSPFIIYPVCRAFHSGLIAVSDPAIRVTPMNPWELMHQILWRRLRWWIVGWSLALVLYIGFFFLVRYHRIFFGERLKYFLYWLSYPAAIIGLGSFLVASCVIRARRRVKFAFLFWATYGIGSLLYFLTLVGTLLVVLLYPFPPFLILDMSPRGYDIGVGNTQGVMASIAYWSSLIGVAITVLIWRLAHKKGGKWFRFEGADP